MSLLVFNHNCISELRRESSKIYGLHNALYNLDVDIPNMWMLYDRNYTNEKMMSIFKEYEVIKLKKNKQLKIQTTCTLFFNQDTTVYFQWYNRGVAISEKILMQLKYGEILSLDKSFANKKNTDLIVKMFII